MPKYIRKIVKNGAGTYYISLPKEIMKKLHYKERQKLTLRTSGQRIIIEDY